ncbi:MAG: arabinose transporter permease [Hyphomicrobiales bacterium]|nr:arabinose transporter permease [Hyphomicrobiales bacterium]
MQPKEPDLSGRREAFVLVGVLATAYMISQFFRNSIGVIGPDLAREFDLDATALSLLASIFFLSFAAVQIPLGVAIDRFGPRAAMLATALVMLGGTFYFAMARGFGDLVAARFIIGLGCSSFLMAPLAIYSMRFDPRKFSGIIAIHVGGGNVGSLAATAPLAFGAATIGWRNSFLIVFAVALVATLLVYVLVKESAAARRDRDARRESASQLFSGVLSAVRIRSFWTIFLMQMATYPAFAAILGLWSGPWLAHVYDMPVEARGNTLLAMVGAQMAGLMVWGSTDRFFGSYKIPVIIGSCLGAGLLGVGALVALPLWAVTPYLMAFGFVFGFSPLLTAHGKSLFPERLMGRGLSLMNIAGIGGVFLQQMLTGALIAYFPAELVDGARVYPPEAYRAVFGFLGLELCLALLLYVRVRDPHPSKAL